MNTIKLSDLDRLIEIGIELGDLAAKVKSEGMEREALALLESTRSVQNAIRFLRDCAEYAAGIRSLPPTHSN